MSEPSFRRDWISKPIFGWAGHVLPTLSDTEREAIEAGDVWWDADLFAGKFATITPLLWLLFAINLMVFYFVTIWMQTIITPAIVKAGGSAATAQNANLMFQLGGSICALVMCRFVDRMGLRPVVLR